MARTATFANKFARAAAVEALMTGDAELSYYLLRELEKTNLVKFVFVKKNEGRGRPTKTVEVTGKGRGYVALSKNWKKAA